ncbi:sensor histidine kinase [Streptomyces sp. 8N616]|uniref:sensor histidine kinase n=1 Tax=Streptomyces sp. 8N616 TaxID=3457414 RepID=UPI003FCF1C4B
MRRTARALIGRRARLRWVHLVLGGALLMPYFLLASVAVGPLAPDRNVFTALPLQLAAYALALPVAALTAFFPLVRPLSVAAIRALCGVPAESLAGGPAQSRAARIRTAAWYTLHLALGGVISGATLAVPPFSAVLVVLPLFAGLRDPRLGVPEVFDGAGLALAPVAGVAVLIALAAVAAAAGALLARCAPVLLGPTPADRLAVAEERAATLAQRNRLARELHDSVGHALSAVSLQASAARKVLDAEPEFAREALAAIEETARRTVGELDTVLGLLRDGEDRGGEDEEAARAPGPTLAELGGLLDRTRAAGAAVEPTTLGDLGGLPDVVSREAYRIVQEGLGNALRHAGQVPVRLWIALDEGELEIRMENPVVARRDEAGRAEADRGAKAGRSEGERGDAPSAGTGRDGTGRGGTGRGGTGRGGTGRGEAGCGGGRGLRGIAERAALLHGSSSAGENGGVWRLTVRLPVGAAR